MRALRALVDDRSVEDAFAKAIRACAARGDLDNGRRLHREIASSRYGGSRYLGNLLVQMYGECGSACEARATFDAAHRRNECSWNLMVLAFARNGLLWEARCAFEAMAMRSDVAWNSMLVAYTDNGQIEEAAALFEMRRVEDVVSINIMVTAFGRVGHLDQAKAMFDRVTPQQLNTLSWNNLLTAYAQNGRMAEATRIFAIIPEKNLVSWNVMLSSCANPCEAMQVFRTMVLEGFKPDKGSFTIAADTCDALAEAKWIFAIAVEMGIQSTVGIAMVNMFAKCSSMADARLAFDGMGSDAKPLAWTTMVTAYAQAGDLQEARGVFDLMPTRDVVAWTAMLNAYARCGCIDLARETFDRTPQRDVVAWNAMVLSNAHCGHVLEARRTFDSMPERWSTSWTTMVSAYAQAGHSKEGLLLFKIMDLEGVEISDVAMVSALDACAGCSAGAEGAQLCAEARHRGLVSRNTIVASAVVNMLAKCAKPDQARDAFADIPNPNIVSWTVLVSAFARLGRGPDAVHLFGLMELQGEIPNWVTMSTIMSACSHGGLLEEARWHFVRMWGDYGLVPGYDHYVCMVNLLGRAGQLERMEELLATMPFHCDRIALTAGLEACRLHGDAGRGARIAGDAMQATRGDSAPYMLLANLWTTSQNLLGII